MCGICKCAESVVCCCFSCAWNLFISLVSGIIILLIIIGVIVYFVVFHNKDDTHQNVTEQMHSNLTQLIKQTIENTRNQIS
ncbi:protein midgut expression 1 isoform X1 [Hermetia illucens]|uniref:protein midgut expression 1 isoform X1 n=1 Tax=Hermetia illucens TaxID=343691 RepID=UPI0018CC685E|nr:protein midgut expression 1 isoform X1 [Hermetia illucens]XP_037904579.1 protein midgut expression 1 isoform X1 [Hermetia illucens]XP_037904580.1 protein midgut expression 1 isoform X1 [Hermetia illucens]